MTFPFLSRHMKEALKEDSTLTEYLRMLYIIQVLDVPAKFNVGFEFLKENTDEILKV